MKLKELLEQCSDVELTKEQVKQVKDYLGIKETKKWRPKKDESYFIINGKGEVDRILRACPEYSDHQFRVFTNNCFQTEEKAKFRLEQIKVYNELKNFADENNKEIDWGNNLEKYYIYRAISTNELNISSLSNMQDLGQIYFSSYELAKQAIEKIGHERIRKYLFGVE